MEFEGKKRKRASNFNADDKIILLSLIEGNPIILKKKTDSATNRDKDKAWQVLVEKFNSCAKDTRQAEGLKKTWAKLKQDAKTYRAKERINCVQTGSSPSDVKTDPILEKVLSILGRAGTGIHNINDCDHDDNDAALEYTYAIQEIDDTDFVELVSQKETILVADTIEAPPANETHFVGLISQKETTVAANKLEAPPANETTPAIFKRRRPLLTKQSERKENRLLEAKLLTEKKKQQVMDEENERSRELHALKMKSVQKDLEIKDIVINKIKDGEPVREELIQLFLNNH